jgi:hypothetical protein
MKGSHAMETKVLRSGLLGLLFGAGIVFAISTVLKSPTTYSANNAPVVIRGGSVGIRIPNDWKAVTAGSSNVFSVDTKTASASNGTTNSITLDGVDPNNGNSPSSVSKPGLTTNWTIKLNFHDKDTKDTLSICTNLNATQDDCETNNKPLTSMLYFVSDGKGDFADMSNFNGSFQKSYDLKTCDDVPPTKQCNHLLKVHIDGVSGSHEFQCVAGMCDIGIGQ